MFLTYTVSSNLISRARNLIVPTMARIGRHFVVSVADLLKSFIVISYLVGIIIEHLCYIFGLTIVFRLTLLL